MDTRKAWDTILNNFGTETFEFPTILKVKRTPVWFSAYAEGNKIIIDKAINNRPSSKLKAKRILYYQQFVDVLPLYYKRKNGERVSKELVEETGNSVYFLSVIKHMYDVD